ncbi:hypothetical protein CLHOM_30680 [Clostridium homopropionicum DSM 5847]|uniref:Probable zinc-binding domain-containing protein n=2 Tax=Clostridium TaxID=1485 RepID=A0A0L6Z5F6_9CLOT|nr:hypothetical protein CLHOM_30680 [Clostridium homopropionicum DSM 5847]SFF71580.1 Probable zinc-ribbon domain-containing protein [Clostridium homopropionicum]
MNNIFRYAKIITENIAIKLSCAENFQLKVEAYGKETRSLRKKEIYKMADKTLVCKDCGKDFVFTEGEQEFYKEKGFENEPVRCPECRKARKQQRNNGRGFNR